MEDVLILGGTGAMGLYLVDILAEAGYNIDVTSRIKREDKNNVTYIVGNALDPKFIEHILVKKRYKAIIDFMTYTTEQFKSRYKLLINNTDQYFLLSTSRVYADSRILNEDSPRLLDVVEDKEYLKTDEYALTKARQEDILNNCDSNNFTIIRPYMTYSDNRLQLGVLDKDTFIQRALKGRSIVLPKDIFSCSTTLTYGYDVSNCIYKLIGNSSALGQTYHITTSKYIKWTNVIDIYLNVFEEKIGFRPKVVMINHCPQLSDEMGRYQVLYDRLYNRHFDNTKIVEVVGGYTFTDPEVGLNQCMSSFLNNTTFSRLDGKTEGTHDYYSKEYTPLSEFKTLKQKLFYLTYRTNPIIASKLLFLIKKVPFGVNKLD